MCGLLMMPGVSEHLPVEKTCIAELRQALLRQRAAAETLAFEVSVRYLAVLEQLAKDPGTDIAFVVNVPGSELPYRVEPERVAGIFAIILKRYQEMCSWTPLHDARAIAREAQEKLKTAADLLERILEGERGEHFEREVTDFVRPLSST